jgi:hypothetical protein
MVLILVKAVPIRLNSGRRTQELVILTINLYLLKDSGLEFSNLDYQAVDTRTLTALVGPIIGAHKLDPCTKSF